MNACQLKASLIDFIKTLRKKFKEAIRSDCSYIEGGNLTSLQHVTEKRLDQVAPMKKINLRGNSKSHMTSQLRKAIIKRSRFHYKQKRGVTSSETTIANIFNNYFANITESLDIPAWNPDNSRNNTALERERERERKRER